MKRRVLIVDDVLVNRKLAMAFFAKFDWWAEEVEGGRAALARLTQNPSVDLLLLDISMPGMGGEEVCRQLRADPLFADLPIVAYTAHALNHDVAHFLANGFNEVLLKPTSMQALKDVLARLFEDNAVE